MSSTEVEFFALEGGVAERPYSLGGVTDMPIRLKTAARVTAELLAPYRDVEVRSVWLSGKPHTDRDIAMAAETFPQLAEVFVPNGKAITDGAVRALLPVSADFRAFTAYWSQVTDEGAKLLASFPELRMVRLNQARITDEGLAALGQCESLEILSLDGNFRIQGRGLAAFRGHPSLRVVFMSGTTIDDDSVGYLSGCDKLERLALSSTSVTERCLLTLPRKPDLEVFLPRELDQERVDDVRRGLPFAVDGLGPDHVIDIPRAIDGTPVELPAQLRGNSPTFAMFTSKSCAPCAWLKTTYDQVRPSLREQFRYVELEVEENLALASALHVRSVPTVFILQFGIELQRFTGACSRERLTEYLERALNA